MKTANTIKSVPLTDIQKMVEYQALLPAQRTYVDVLLRNVETTGALNFLAATAIAYPRSARTPHALAVRSSQTQSHPKVRKVLNLVFGKTENDVESLLKDLRRLIQVYGRHVGKAATHGK